MTKDKWIKSRPAPNTLSYFFFLLMLRGNPKSSQEKDGDYIKESRIKQTSPSLGIIIEECIKW